MTGMNKKTGRRLSGIDHIKQSIADILLTPIGSSVMRREYGSLLPELIDHPSNGANTLRMMTATVMALGKWEPRITVNQISFALSDNSGRMELSINGSLADASGRASDLALNVSLGGLR